MAFFYKQVLVAVAAQDCLTQGINCNRDFFAAPVLVGIEAKQFCRKKPQA